MSTIRENYQTITGNIRRAAEAAGRSYGDITLIGVTKFFPVEAIAEAVECGLSSVGENRVQELLSKLDYFSENELNVHLIGQLQTNKVKYVVGRVTLIQSVDRPALAQAINARAATLGIVQDILLEVNIGGEEQKGGVCVNDLPALMQLISGMPNICVKGLMCVPPAVGEEAARPYFAQMKKLFDGLSGSDIPNVSMQQLSMGMSGDYMSAIAEGATMVRVGSALFGQRVY